MNFVQYIYISKILKRKDNSFIYINYLNLIFSINVANFLYYNSLIANKSTILFVENEFKHFSLS